MKIPSVKNINKDIFNRILDGSSSPSQLNHFIEDCFKISHIHVRMHSQKLTKAMDKLLTDFDEIAVVSIESLFQKDGTGCFQNLKKTAEAWQSPLNSDKDIIFFLNKIIAQRVENTICDLLKESDPFYDYFYDHLTYLIGKFGYKKQTTCGKVYICEGEAFITEKIIPDDYFFNFPSDLFTDNKDFLKNLFARIKELGYNPLIPFNLLISRLKSLNLNNIQDRELSFEYNMDIKEIAESSIKAIKEKIKNTYTETKKITDTEAQVLANAFEKIAADMRDGGISGDLSDYVIQENRNITKDEYEKKYRNITEYLFKLMKRDLSDKIKSYMNSVHKNNQSIV